MHLLRFSCSIVLVWIIIISYVDSQIFRIRKNVSTEVLDKYGIDHSILNQDIPESGLIVNIGSKLSALDVKGRPSIGSRVRVKRLEDGSQPSIVELLSANLAQIFGNRTQDSKTDIPTPVPTNAPASSNETESSKLNATEITVTPNCGRVPYYEKLYGKSFNTSHLDDSGHFRILHGLDAVVGEWPWVVRIEECKPNKDCGICTGTLLNDRWIITAGHCGFNKSASNFNITFGLYDLLSPDQGSFSRSVDKLVVHPDYKDLSNDLTLMRLSQPVNFTDQVQPACLVSPTRNIVTTVGERPAFAVGYGLVESMMDAVRLQKLRVSPKQPADCNSDTLGNVQLRRNTVCMGPPPGQIGGSCKGDSGGPDLYYDLTQDRWFIFATVSFGPADCDREEGDKWLTVSVDLSSYRTWILNTISSNS